jgi:YHYH protein
MKTILASIVIEIILAFAVSASADDPRTNSWFTTYAGQYARSYTNVASQSSGNAVTTWGNGTQTQSLPAYCGVQEVYSSSNWVYFRTTGLASHTMGAWQTGFPNLPANQKVLYRIPRTNIITVPMTKSLTALGAIGYFVDGVAMFDSRDGFVWTGSGESGSGAGYWNRDAYVNESATFDPAYAHQENTGTYHYHANPIALRYLMGDHVTYNAVAKTYSEATNAVTKHSPLLGWVRDGFPVYGPYGYSVSNDASSGVRRMISGYVLRNGRSGTDNLTNTLRANLPAWAQRLYGLNSAGPTDTSTYPVGRYMEDKAYLGDLTNSLTGSNFVQGVDFDLDEYNGRWCVTPEFPNGTYAYFVSMSTNGTPVFPYNIGRAFYANPTGAVATAISETVVTNYLGGPNATPSLNSPTVKNGAVTLFWSATEGGTYMVLSTTNLTTWTTNSTTVAAVLNAASYTNNPTDGHHFYRVVQTALATYDPVSGSGGATYYAPGGSVSRGNGTNITLSITLPTGGSNPPMTPPANAPVTSVMLGSLTATSSSYAVQGTVLANFSILPGTATGAQNVVVTFGIPPGQSQAPTFTLTGGFTINP